jgi:hypothetical protein
MLSLFSIIVGCAAEYNVMLVVGASEYRPAMTWDEIRETGIKKPYTMRVFDADGHPVHLNRYNHDDGSIMPLAEMEIHISTPIIVDKKYETVSLVVLDHGKEVTKTRVAIKELKPVKGGPKASVIRVELPL